jgi:two-component system, cell cycle sensor histidine kinase and response regulator CckA
MTGVNYDITEYKEADEALRTHEERLRLAMEATQQGWFDLNVQTGEVTVSEEYARIIGHDPAEFSRNLQGWIGGIHPTDRDNAKKAMRGEKLGLNEYKALRKDGSTFPIIMHSAAKFRDGEPTGLRGVVIDVTETKKLEAQLRQAHKMEAIGTLAGGIAHDFNNILAAIIGYTEMALTDLSKASSARHYLGQVLKAGHRAKDLVKQILASNRQKQSQERVPVEIAVVIKEALNLLRPSLPATIEILQNIGSETGMAFADPTEIHQVLVNLCTYAAHAMEEHGGVLELSLGEVTIDSEAGTAPAGLNPGPYLRLTVSDTGHGIDPAVLEKIFDPYFTTKEVGGGSGLGLAVVQGVVKRHEGAVTVSSEPGKGTSFHVYLPQVESLAGNEVNEEEEQFPKGKERILFVDDEAILVEMGRSVLEWLGYEVSGTTSRIEALELFRTRPDRFDLVITDYTMPHMIGVDLARFWVTRGFIKSTRMPSSLV